ncbi:hypothetical protein ANN_01250 [Periplaneta americana]|uniref:Uncharacterized protein n=1 Tax=Periplaneta americana TaxID=6978 RepID=A0ABQ8TT15_PERAM|nr:hypothetical protein ANN_01250 [Periplaneta americana]
MSPGSNTESYPAFAHIGLRENPGKNLNQVTCPNRESNPGHLVSRLDARTVTPQGVSEVVLQTFRDDGEGHMYQFEIRNPGPEMADGRQHSLKCAKGKWCRPVCTVVQQEEVESIPASSYECTMVHCVFRGYVSSTLSPRDVLQRYEVPLLEEGGIRDSCAAFARQAALWKGELATKRPALVLFNWDTLAN